MESPIIPKHLIFNLKHVVISNGRVLPAQKERDGNIHKLGWSFVMDVMATSWDHCNLSTRVERLDLVGVLGFDVPRGATANEEGLAWESLQIWCVHPTRQGAVQHVQVEAPFVGFRSFWITN